MVLTVRSLVLMKCTSTKNAGGKSKPRSRTSRTDVAETEAGFHSHDLIQDVFSSLLLLLFLHKSVQ